MKQLGCTTDPNAAWGHCPQRSTTTTATADDDADDNDDVGDDAFYNCAHSSC